MWEAKQHLPLQEWRRRQWRLRWSFLPPQPLLQEWLPWVRHRLLHLYGLRLQ